MPTAANYVDKIVSVKNTGASDAWVRVLVAFQASLDQTGPAENNKMHWSYGNRVALDGNYTEAWGNDWNNHWKWDYSDPVPIEIDGVAYNVYCFYYTEKLAKGEQTSAAIAGMYLDNKVDYDADNGYYTYNGKEIEGFDGTVVVPVLAQAVQASGFETDATSKGYEKAFAAAFPYTSTEEGAETNGELKSWFEDMLNVEPETPTPDEENDDVYEIGTAAELFGFANMVNEQGNNFDGKTVVLTADINLANQEWTPIGQTGATQFLGTFDGQGHTISNLYIDSSAQTGEHYSSGLFGWLNNATVKDLTVVGATVTGNHNVGVIAGYMETSGCTISDCHVSNATVTCTHANDAACGDKAGVIVGHAGNAGVKVENCTAKDSTVTAGRDAGQIVGAALEVNVVGCSAENVTVTAGGDCTGANINEAVIGRIL